MMGQQRRGWSVVAMFVVVAMSLQVAAGRSLANGSNSQDVFLVSVFDCYMPVPNSFVLNTQDSTGFSLFLGDPFEAMRIKISQYNADLGSSFTELKKQNVDALVIEELQNSIRKDVRITRIHNEKQQVLVYGGTDELIDLLVQGCVSKKHGELLTE